MNNREGWIRSHLWRLRFGQFLQRAGEWLSGFLIMFALMVLIVKRLWPEMWPHVLWLGVLAIPVTWMAWRLSMRWAFTREESVALLDRTLGAGGLLMALSEVPDLEWNLRLPQLEEKWRQSLPKFRPSRFASCVLLPLLFAIGVCFIPLRDISAEEGLPLTSAGERASARLEELLAVLKEAEVLEEEEQKEFDEAIQKLTAETRDAPLTHEKWETVDALEKKLRDRLERADLTMEQAAEAAELLAEEAAGVTSLTEAQKQELEEELIETLRKKKETQKDASSSSNPEHKAQLNDLLQRLTKNDSQPPKLPEDPAERQQLLDDLKEFLEEEQQSLQELRKSLGEQLDGAQLGEMIDGEFKECKEGTCANCGKKDDTGDPMNGKPCDGVCTECQKQGVKPGGKTGRGGVSRGPGHAPLTWGEESDETKVQFLEVALPKGFQEDPKEQTIGVRLIAPDVDPDATAARSAARDAQGSSGRETAQRTLRPRHQDVVRKFFSDGAEPEKSDGKK